MTEAVTVALITAAATIAAQVVINLRFHSRREAEAAAQNALILRRIDELEAKVNKHNNLIERIYKVEAAAAGLQRQVDELKGGR